MRFDGCFGKFRLLFAAPEDWPEPMHTGCQGAGGFLSVRFTAGIKFQSRPTSRVCQFLAALHSCEPLTAEAIQRAGTAYGRTH